MVLPETQSMSHVLLHTGTTSYFVNSTLTLGWNVLSLSDDKICLGQMIQWLCCASSVKMLKNRTGSNLLREGYKCGKFVYS